MLAITLSKNPRACPSPRRTVGGLERTDKMAIIMATAYVLIKTKPGHERDVYYNLARRRRFAELHPVIGQYNLVAKVTSDSMERVGHIVIDELNRTDNVSSYETLNTTRF